MWSWNETSDSLVKNQISCAEYHRVTTGLDCGHRCIVRPLDGSCAYCSKIVDASNDHQHYHQWMMTMMKIVVYIVVVMDDYGYYHSLCLLLLLLSCHLTCDGDDGDGGCECDEPVIDHLGMGRVCMRRTWKCP